VRIAITGGIAEGKSTVLGYIRDMGQPVASADEVARQVFADSEVLSRIQAALGASERAAVREIIARDPKLKAELNAITHPEIHRRLIASPAHFFEVPLLVEVCVMRDFDQCWVVTCGPEEQMRRLVLRYGDEEHARALLELQLPTRAKTPFSDTVIRTNASEECVRHLVEESVKRVLAG
jgi:dephospho-CoA kinase